MTSTSSNTCFLSPHFPLNCVVAAGSFYSPPLHSYHHHCHHHPHFAKPPASSPAHSPHENSSVCCFMRKSNLGHLSFCPQAPPLLSLIAQPWHLILKPELLAVDIHFSLKVAATWMQIQVACCTVVNKALQGLSTGVTISFALVPAVLLFTLGIGWFMEKFEGGVSKEVMGSGFSGVKRI